MIYKMKIDFKRCFIPHTLSHNLLGIGLGIVLVSLIPDLNNILYGVGAIVVALVWDMMQK